MDQPKCSAGRFVGFCCAINYDDARVNFDSRPVGSLAQSHHHARRQSFKLQVQVRNFRKTFVSQLIFSLGKKIEHQPLF